MDGKLQIRIQRYGWDAAALHYDLGWNANLLPAQQTLMSMASLSGGQKVLETACGSGLVTKMISDAVGTSGTIVATDLSQAMVDQTKDLGLENVKTARMGVEKLDVPDAEFDRAICALGLMYSPDPPLAIREMHRVLRSDGRAVATVWGERRNCGWAEVFPIVDKRVQSEVCPMFFATGAPGGLVKDFGEAGFSDIEEYRQSETLVYKSARELTDAVLLGGPVALAVKRFDDSTMSEVCEEFLDSVSTFAVGNGYRIPGEFVTVSGIRSSQ